MSISKVLRFFELCADEQTADQTIEEELRYLLSDTSWRPVPELLKQLSVLDETTQTDLLGLVVKRIHANSHKFQGLNERAILKAFYVRFAVAFLPVDEETLSMRMSDIIRTFTHESAIYCFNTNRYHHLRAFRKSLMVAVTSELSRIKADAGFLHKAYLICRLHEDLFDLADVILKRVREETAATASLDAMYEAELGKISAATLRARNDGLSFSLRRSSSKLRIAVCISGQMRGYSQALPSWDCLGLNDHDTDYYVNTWSDIGFRGYSSSHLDRLFSSEVIETGIPALLRTHEDKTIEELYPHLTKMTGARTITQEEIEESYKTPNVIVEDSSAPTALAMTAPESMHYKIYHSIFSSIPDERRGTYDLIVRIRPDLKIQSASVDWSKIYYTSLNDRVIYADSAGIVFKTGAFGVGDQFACGTPQDMEVYARTFISERSPSYRQQKFQGGIKGHQSIFLNCIYHGVGFRRIRSISWGGLCDNEKIGANKLHALVTEARNLRRPHTLDDQIIALLSNFTNPSPTATVQGLAENARGNI